MKFFLSVEIWHEIDDIYIAISNRIEHTLNSELKDRSYGEALNNISIIPIVMPKDHLSYTDSNGNLFHKERKLFKRKDHSADYRLIIDYEKFLNGNEKDREALIINNIYKAIIDLERKASGNFDGESLIQDILTMFNLSKLEIENI